MKIEDSEVNFGDNNELNEEVKLESKRRQTNNQILASTLSSLAAYDPKNKQWSAYLSEGTTTKNDLTLEELSELAASVPQSTLKSILKINNYVRYYINFDDLFGKTYESIETNTNTKYKLAYKDYSKNRNKTSTLKKAQSIIDDFNKQIKLERLIRKVVPMTFAEGNYIMYLRKNKTNYVVDYFPLEVAVVSDYERGDKPVVLIDMTVLKKRLQKTYLKDKKNKELLLKNMEAEILNNYPPEVYEAYKNNERYAVLNTDNTGVIRICNMNRKYGLTPFFRALKPLLMLYNFENADFVNAKAKAKKILHQKLRKDLLTSQEEELQGLADMVYAHNNLMSAWSQNTVLVTTPPAVEEISYVEPNTEDIDVDKINLYRAIVMTTLGIGFLNSESSQAFTVANISIRQLMLTINKITEQLEAILNDWYRLVLKDNGVEAEYAPDITVVDAEQMELEIKQSLADFLYSKLNCSLRTAYDVLGYSIEDEKAKRIEENETGLDEIFKPHATSFNSAGDSSDSEAGRPADTSPADGGVKQEYDKDYQQTKK